MQDPDEGLVYGFDGALAGVDAYGHSCVHACHCDAIPWLGCIHKLVKGEHGQRVRRLPFRDGIGALLHNRIDVRQNSDSTPWDWAQGQYRIIVCEAALAPECDRCTPASEPGMILARLMLQPSRVAPHVVGTAAMCSPLQQSSPPLSGASTVLP